MAFFVNRSLVLSESSNSEATHGFKDFDVKERSVTLLDVNCPEVFKDPEFLKWLNDTDYVKFTWHVPGKPANDYSDVIVTYDNGEGSNSDMPEHVWNWLCDLWQKTLGKGYGWIRLTNME